MVNDLITKKLTQQQKRQMKNNITVILDSAHGEETPGKRSPDGKFREYLWSRQRIASLRPRFEELGFTVYETNPSNKEIGLTPRANNANSVKGRKLFMSLHVDAAGNGRDWLNATGYSVYTTKGKTQSDDLAECILKRFRAEFPELRGRFDSTDGDLDKEENFTVIYKANCPAVLIEWLFQDNRADVERLQSDDYNSRYEASIVHGVMDFCRQIGWLS